MTRASPQDTVSYRTGAKADPDYDLFYVPGNPGVVAYYEQFLGQVHDQVNAHFRDAGVSVAVRGHSLAGFEVSPERDSLRSLWGLKDLRAELEFLRGKMEEVCRGRQRKPRIILAGHSIGAWFVMCLLEEYGKRRKSEEVDYELIGGICLFPTIVDIYKSPAGRRASRIAGVPGFRFIVQLLAWVLTGLIRGSWRTWVVSTVTGMPIAAAAVTAAWLATWTGVAQALYMAKDELKTVTTDRWSDELWGVSESTGNGSTPSLYFFFGRNDHWVAEDTREEIVMARRSSNSGDGGPRFEVDETGIPHSFPLKHTDPVAKKTAGYLIDCIARDRKLRR